MKTVQRVRVALTLVWLACTGPAILIVVAQTINGKFGNDLSALFMGLGWLVPLWTPITTMMLVPLTAKIDKSKPAEMFEGGGILVVTYFAMVLYFACIYLVIVLDSVSEVPTARIYLWSTWAFVPLQALLIGLLTKLFLE
jgi:hypothetical protein